MKRPERDNSDHCESFADLELEPITPYEIMICLAGNSPLFEAMYACMFSLPPKHFAGKPVEEMASELAEACSTPPEHFLKALGKAREATNGHRE